MKIPKPTDTVSGSGAYIRQMLLLGHTDYTGLAEAVRSHWKGRKTTVKDVSWNHQKLRQEGLNPPPWQQHMATPTVAQVDTACKKSASVDQQSQIRPKAHPTQDRGRRFDRTSCTYSAFHQRHHRDYAAHYFRWGFITRKVLSGKRVLDVGCGVDCPVVKLTDELGGSLCPGKYVGVDLNKLLKPPKRPWAIFHGEFDFTKRYKELSRFDVALCLEVIEHMHLENGERLLRGIHDRLVKGGHLYLSTPVFNGKRAANHLHEYEIEELDHLVKKVGFTVVKRFGTFANISAIRKAARPEEVEVLDRLKEYYNNNVLSCFLAPLYPNASRNNLWVLRKGK